jgi:hypothetical protein
VSLYQSTNGSHWTVNTNWLLNDPCQDNWFGVVCKSDNSRVVQLYVYHNIPHQSSEKDCTIDQCGAG